MKNTSQSVVEVVTAGKVLLTGVWDWTVSVAPADEEVMSENLLKKDKCPMSSLSS